jgi:hypothetical protein
LRFFLGNFQAAHPAGRDVERRRYNGKSSRVNRRSKPARVGVSETNPNAKRVSQLMLGGAMLTPTHAG